MFERRSVRICLLLMLALLYGGWTKENGPAPQFTYSLQMASDTRLNAVPADPRASLADYDQLLLMDAQPRNSGRP